MFRKGSFVLATLALMVVAPLAHAHDCSLAIGGGVAIPTGDFSKKFDFTSSTSTGLDASVGYVITPEFTYMVNDKLGLGVDATYSTNNIKKEDRDAIRTANADPTFDLKYTQFGGGAHAKLMMPMQNGPFSPYLVVGAGVANFKAKVESSDPAVAGDKSKSGFAGRVGVGAGYKAGQQMSIGVEGDYNFMSLKKEDFNGVSSAPSIGVKAVVSFLFKGMPK